MTLMREHRVRQVKRHPTALNTIAHAQSVIAHQILADRAFNFLLLLAQQFIAAVCEYPALQIRLGLS